MSAIFSSGQLRASRLTPTEQSAQRRSDAWRRWEAEELVHHGETAVLDLLQLELVEVAALGEACAAKGERAASAQLSSALNKTAEEQWMGCDAV
jgi:hypothetical protein